MKKLKLALLLAVINLLPACSVMNSGFSCNATAGDGCLSLDEVNAMTESSTAPSASVPKPAKRALPNTSGKRIWIAPWADKKGVQHPGALVYVPELAEGASA